MFTHFGFWSPMTLPYITMNVKSIHCFLRGHCSSPKDLGMESQDFGGHILGLDSRGCLSV